MNIFIKLFYIFIVVIILNTSLMAMNDDEAQPLLDPRKAFPILHQQVDTKGVPLKGKGVKIMMVDTIANPSYSKYNYTTEVHNYGRSINDLIRVGQKILHGNMTLDLVAMLPGEKNHCVGGAYEATILLSGVLGNEYEHEYAPPSSAKKYFDLFFKDLEDFKPDILSWSINPDVFSREQKAKITAYINKNQVLNIMAAGNWSSAMPNLLSDVDLYTIYVLNATKDKGVNPLASWHSPLPPKEQEELFTEMESILDKHDLSWIDLKEKLNWIENKKSNGITTEDDINFFYSIFSKYPTLIEKIVGKDPSSKTKEQTLDLIGTYAYAVGSPAPFPMNLKFLYRLFPFSNYAAKSKKNHTITTIGSNISTRDWLTSVCGTSYSTPFVTSLAALLYQKCSAVPKDKRALFVKNSILDSALPTDRPKIYGKGFLQPLKVFDHNPTLHQVSANLLLADYKELLSAMKKEKEVFSNSIKGIIDINRESYQRAKAQWEAFDKEETLLLEDRESKDNITEKLKLITLEKRKLYAEQTNLTNELEKFNRERHPNPYAKIVYVLKTLPREKDECQLNSYLLYLKDALEQIKQKDINILKIKDRILF